MADEEPDSRCLLLKNWNDIKLDFIELAEGLSWKNAIANKIGKFVRRFAPD